MEFDFEQLDGIINARSLAIVGASSSPMKFGCLYTASQLEMDFTGDVFLVNPREKEMMGHRVYPDLLSLPQPVDLVYTTVPADRTIDVLLDCASSGVKCVVIMASGFSESGEWGSALEQRALELAREGGFRIIGPNCFGIYNPRNRLTMLPGRDFSNTSGDTAFFSQSGGFSVHVVRQCQSLEIGFSAAVSYGNGLDLDETDFMRYFARDENTRFIAGYLEGVSDGRKFLSALREAASLKPVILWKVGKGEASRRAVSSHTGSVAGAADIWEGVVRQEGVISASGVDEVCDILLALEHLGRNPGKRVLLCGGGGGLGTYAADIAEQEGLSVPSLEGENLAVMQEALRRAGAVAGNPMDIGAPLIPPAEFQAALRAAAMSETTDILVFDLAVNFAYDLAGEAGLGLAAEILAGVRDEFQKPVVAVVYSRSFDGEDLVLERISRGLRDKLLANGIPVFDSAKCALRAISRING